MTIEALDEIDDLLAPMIAPLREKIANENLAILSVKVQLIFQQKKESLWLLSSDTVTADSRTRFASYAKEVVDEIAIRQEDQLALVVMKEFSPLLPTVKPEQIPNTLAFLCPKLRDGLELFDDAVLFGAQHLLAGEKPEDIETKLKSLDPNALKAEALAFRQKIQNSSNEELFYLFRPFLTDFHGAFKPILLAAANENKEALLKQECKKIATVFQQTLDDVRACRNVTQLTEMKVGVLLVPLDEPPHTPFVGMYHVSAQGQAAWQWADTIETLNQFFH